MTDYAQFIAVAKDAALKAGEILKADFSRKHVATFKSSHDIGLEIDQRCETVILDVIKSAFPSHSIFSEEGGVWNHDGEYLWFIDPLDGTNNFYAGIGYFAVSIALKRHEEIIIGLVFNPITNQMFAALKGKGATLNGETISPSDIRKLNTAVLSFIKGHRTYDGGILEETSKEVEAHLENYFRRTLKTWAPALDWCLMASGGIDALVSFESELEDQYAGTLIAQEAGAEVISFDGKPYHPGVTRIIATPPHLRNEMVELLQGFAGS